ADLRLALGWDAEAGLSDAGATVYAARGLGGVGVTIPGSRGVIAALIGIGVSGAAAALPGALEVPFELRLAVGAGAYRVHGWARASWIIGERSRQLRMGSGWLDGDEISVGAGVTLPGRGRLFLGAAYDRAAVGDSASLLAGIPIGGYY